MTCLTSGCDRERIPESPTGIAHAHCAACESRLTREAWGPVSWTERALTNTLPALVVGGVPIETTPLDPAIDAAPVPLSGRGIDQRAERPPVSPGAA